MSSRNAASALTSWAWFLACKRLVLLDSSLGYSLRVLRQRGMWSDLACWTR